jgi:hypothetical protein
MNLRRTFMTASEWVASVLAALAFVYLMFGD